MPALDSTRRVLDKLSCTLADVADKQHAATIAEKAGQVNRDELAKELNLGTLLLDDIVVQLSRPGRDPREDLPPPI
ncbi:MAG: hypothetical protein HC937_02685, partial [Aquincola sp.]|nr:hypothetical protein [Aquincola sp.]